MKVLSFTFFLCITASLFSQNKIQLDKDIDYNNLAKLITFSDSIYSDEVMIIHKKKVIRHWKSGKCDSLYYGTASMLKSWTGLVIGIMIDKGLINSEDDLVCAYIPDWEDGCIKQVTIKNLLTMTAGFNRRGPRGILSAQDANNYALNSKLDTIPNIKFGYSNESAQLLGILIEKLSKKKANQYFKEVLFVPLGMDSTKLRKDMSNKNYITYGGAKTTIQDASKVGLLMINKGNLNGKQVVSESWINKSITASEIAKPYEYGYFWWLGNISGNRIYSAMGDLGQLTLVYPDLDLIYLRRQKCNNTKFRRMEWMGLDFLNLISSVVKKK